MARRFKIIGMASSNQLHEIELEILIHFRQICIENQLTYYLTAGTLLGAIRHKGFIPWDDDIDILMPRKDYNKLSNLSAEIMTKNLFLQNNKTDTNFPFYFSKIRKNNTNVEEEKFSDVSMNKGIYIDIFPLDSCPKTFFFATFFFKIIEFFSFVALSKVSKRFQCGYTKKHMKLLFSLFRCLPLSFIFFLREFIRVLISIFSSDQCLCSVGGTHGYPKESYLADWFKHETVLIFEEELFPAPSCWHEILTSMYGNYMDFPPKNERNGHFINKE